MKCEDFFTISDRIEYKTASWGEISLQNRRTTSQYFVSNEWLFLWGWFIIANKKYWACFDATRSEQKIYLIVKEREIRLNSPLPQINEIRDPKMKKK